MSQFGIERPRDAISFVERLIDSRRDDEDKVKYTKQVVDWLKHLSLSTKSEAGDAEYVLDYFQHSYKVSAFCKNHRIKL